MTQSTDHPLKILFVWIGNSCRSQMAEAWANHFGKDKVRAFSAGTHPLGTIVTETSEVMREKGISLEGQASKGLREVPVAEMDILIGMGSDVPYHAPAGFQGRTLEWNVPDPYACGIDTFRNVRDIIERHVLGLLAEVVDPPNSPPA
jgi:arsenate reductase